MVYIREAHALDSRSPLGGGNHPIVEDPITLDERNEVAKACMTKMALEPMPALVDNMDDAVSEAYAAHPDRIYLVGRDGQIVMHGGRGPSGFLPDELEEAILKELGPGYTPKKNKLRIDDVFGSK